MSYEPENAGLLPAMARLSSRCNSGDVTGVGKSTTELAGLERAEWYTVFPLTDAVLRVEMGRTSGASNPKPSPESCRSLSPMGC